MHEDSIQTIHETKAITAKPRVTFDWSPKGAAWVINIGGNTYPYTVDEPLLGAPAQPEVNFTNNNQELTFTASVETDPGDFILEYYWDFGDGTDGYGPEVTHTYRSYSPTVRVSLQVTDNHRRKVNAGRQLSLVPVELIAVSQGITVEDEVI